MMIFSWFAFVASAALCGAFLGAVIHALSGRPGSNKHETRGVMAMLCACVASIVGWSILNTTVNLWLAVAMPVLLPSLALIIFGLCKLVHGAVVILNRWLDQLGDLTAGLRTALKTRNSNKE